MGNFTSLSGTSKDEASQWKRNVDLCSSKKAKTIESAILKATKHTSHKPPKDKYVTFLLSSTLDGDYGSHTVVAIVQRMRLTTDVCMAAKCLILLHKMINTEYGYKKEVLSHYYKRHSHRPLIYNGGGSNLKLDGLNVKAKASRFTKELSPWVIWYKQYLDRYLHVAEVLGVVPNIKEISEDIRFEIQGVATRPGPERKHIYGFVQIKRPALTTDNIIEQMDSLVDLVELINDKPNPPMLELNKIVIGMKEIVLQDYFSIMTLIKIRFEELNKRLDKKDELAQFLLRLDNCKDCFNESSRTGKKLVDNFRNLISETE